MHYPHQLESLVKPPLQIGLTGGIGSGKTTVCKIFEQIGIPIYYADDRAKQLMVEDGRIIKQIIELFGQDAYLQAGGLNRAFIAGIVFNDPKKLQALNSIVHPAVGKDGTEWHHQQIGVPYTIREAALMIESGNYKAMDKLIVVSAPKQLRIERVMKRDNVNEVAVLARMNQQLAEEEKMKFADFRIINDWRASLIKQVWKIHQQLVFEWTDN